jgi:hypothetical protein
MLLCLTSGDGECEVSVVQCVTDSVVASVVLEGDDASLMPGLRPDQVCVLVEEPPTLYWLAVDGRPVFAAISGPAAERVWAPIVRGALMMPGVTRGDLYDACGRRVLELLPGRNDLSGLTPGAYFVRDSKREVTRIVVVR